MTRGPEGPVHWIERGSGRPLVLLHGLGGDVGFWAAEMEVWAQTFRVIAIDLRGSGATPPSPGGHTMADLADDVVAVLDDAGINTADVLGFSMGGNVALALALAHPRRVGRLVLASTFACMNIQARLFLDAVLRTYEQNRQPDQMFRLIYPWLFSIDFLADPANGAFLVDAEGAPDDQPFEDWRALYLAQQRFDVRQDLDEIGAPTLVVIGDQDRLVSLDDARELSDGLAEARLAELPGAGHLTNVETPEEFRRLVEQFLLP
jgi:3-oxoadipate enol-lactonase